MFLAFGLLAIAAPAAAQREPVQAEAAEMLWERLGQRVRDLAGRVDGVMAVAIKDLTDGKSYLLHPDLVLPTASTIKIAVLAELYRQEQRGGPARLTDIYVADSTDVIPGSDLLGGLSFGLSRITLRDLATFMVGVSDNGATNVLINRLGIERINALLDTLGLTRTRLRRRMLDLAAARAGRENTATAGELVALLEALWTGRVVTGALHDDFFRVLATPKERYLPRLLPDGARIASKPGWLEGVRADAGIGFVARRPFAIAVLISYSGDDRASEQAIAELGLLAWQHFEKLAALGAYGRRLP